MLQISHQYRKELLWIAFSFLLLIGISIYRQLSIHLIPGDPFRPVLVYFVYLLLITGWSGSILNRILQKNMRIFLFAEQMLMLFWMTTRFFQEALFYHDLYLMRVSGYLISFPAFLLPLFGLYASFGLGKSEEYHISRFWYLLLIPAFLMIALTLTNEFHHFVFLSLETEPEPNLYFHPNIGLYILLAWALGFEIERIFLICSRSRIMETTPRLRMLPFFMLGLMLIFTIPYLALSFVVRFELIEYSAFIFFLDAMIWESCIMTGMVPVNSQYQDTFDRSTVSMQILTMSGTPFLISSKAPSLSPELISTLIKTSVFCTAQGQELHLQKIHGGYCVWQKDVSKIRLTVDALQHNAEELEHAGILLSQELKARSDTSRIQEENRIYDQLTQEVHSQLILLEHLLNELEHADNWIAQFQKICLIGTYIKRRCNLRLIEQTDGNIIGEDLALCFQDLIGCLKQMDIPASLHYEIKKLTSPQFALTTLDLFEAALEQEGLMPKALEVRFTSPSSFSLHVISTSDPTTLQNFATQLLTEKHAIRWAFYHNGYELTVCGEES